MRAQCLALGIHRSGFLYCPRASFADSQLLNRIGEIHHDFPYYGYRKIHWCLRQEGYGINHKKVSKLMKEMGIQALFPGPKTSIPGKDGTVFPYLLKGLDIQRPNQVWSVDITYIRLPVGMVYLFALIDWYSRFVVAHQLVNTMEAKHGVELLEVAFASYGFPDICNADQGSQFTGILWIDTLKKNQIQISHDGVGRCIDNVYIERFWRTIKYEDVFIQAYESLPEARRGIKIFIDHYNNRRPHQALDYRYPSSLYFSKTKEEFQ